MLNNTWYLKAGPYHTVSLEAVKYWILVKTFPTFGKVFVVPRSAWLPIGELDDLIEKIEASKELLLKYG